MILAGIGCGVGAYYAKDKKTRLDLMKGAAILYVGQFIESMCSSEWSLLQNQVSQEDAETELESYRAL